MEVFKWMMSNIKKAYYSFCGGWKYTIGFPQSSIEEIMNGEPMRVRWLADSFKNSWFADPFLLDVTDNEYIVLAEEMLLQKHKGVIALLVIDKKSCKIKDHRIVLEEKTHLSFPNILRINGEVFIYPENCASLSLNLYKYDAAKKIFKKVRKIADGDIADSVMVNIFSENWLFATKGSDICPFTLLVMAKNKKNNQYEEYSSVTFSNKIARGAGAFFTYKGELYRPAQECDVCYGHSVSLQKVLGSSMREIQFEEVRRLYTDNPRYELGLHTFNVYKNAIVVDAMGYKHEFARIIGKVSKMLQRQ